MTNEVSYFYNSSYTKEEAKEIIKNFIIRKAEKFIKITTVTLLIVTVFALHHEQKVLAMAELQVQAYHVEQETAGLSVEEMMWNYIETLPIPKSDLPEESTEIVNDVVEVYYEPSEEEREYAYRLAYAEAGVESDLGQILVINVAINNMITQGYDNLIDEFTAKGRYSSVVNGEVYNNGKIVTLENVPENVKDAVDEAFLKDYSEEILKQESEKLGITDPKYWEGGAIYFYNPEVCSNKQNNLRENIKVKFVCGSHTFYRYWDE